MSTPTDKSGKAARSNFALATDLVQGGILRSQFGETAEPIYLTSGYVYDSAEQAEARFKGEDDGYIYSRYGNPTISMLESRMCLMEGAEAARALATGMAAVTSVFLCYLKAGDHVVAAKALFGSCRYVVEVLMPRFGVEATLVDGCDIEQWRQAVRPNTKLLFLESPTNPTLDIIDIAAVSEVAKSVGAKLVVDNVFATPLHQRPLELGADIVVYSATKHIDGQGRCLGGVVLSSNDFIGNHLHNFLRQTGPSMSPFNAWVMLKGLETLPLRVERHCATAAILADHLAGQKAVTRVLYPGRADHPQHALAMRQMASGGPIVSFEVKGGKEAAFTVSNALRLIRISNNLGDAKSLVTHPATTTHQRIGEEARQELGITGGLLRISAGLEDPADLIADIDAALARI